MINLVHHLNKQRSTYPPFSLRKMRTDHYTWKDFNPLRTDHYTLLTGARLPTRQKLPHRYRNHATAWPPPQLKFAV